MKLLKTTAKYIRLKKMLLNTRADLQDLHNTNLHLSKLNMFQVQY